MANTRCYMLVLGAFADFDKFMADYHAGDTSGIEKFGGRYVLVGQSMDVLQGNFTGVGGTVLSAWQDRDSAMRYWNSPDYASIRAGWPPEDAVQVILIDAPMLDGPG